MDKPNVQSTEQKILEAAKKVFMQKGMYGARMQEIADVAGINKALLHYYFRDKKKLFQGIFQEMFKEFLPSAIGILDGEQTLEEKVYQFVDAYISMLSENQYLPVFVISEIHQNPEIIAQFKKLLLKVPASKFLQQLQEGIDQGIYKPIPPNQFMVNLLSVCIFPFLAKPIITEALSMNDAAFQEFINERKKILPEIILNTILRTSKK